MSCLCVQAINSNEVAGMVIVVYNNQLFINNFRRMQ